MCGIVAVFGARNARDGAERALSTLHHRGPDAQGVWSDDGIALGHARLSIIDLSDAGRQPMASHDGRYQLIFNGELYNYVELREQLDDYPFSTQTDTEVVLAAWMRWGAACLDRFLGMFAFVVWDSRERTLHAVRDRFGVKPLYWASLPGGGIVLASEIKALHAAGVPAVPDPIRWSSFLARGAQVSIVDVAPRLRSGAASKPCRPDRSSSRVTTTARSRAGTISRHALAPTTMRATSRQ